jgi:hypothetical protein
MVHQSLKEADEFMGPTHFSHSRHNVQKEGRKVIAATHVNLLTSTCPVAHGTGLSQTAVWHMLHEPLCPFTAQLVQGLYPSDNNFYFQFSWWLQYKTVDEPQFLCHVLWTDEATFTRTGTNSLHNLHEWAHATQYSSSEQRFSISVWARIIYSYLT